MRKHLHIVASICDEVKTEGGKYLEMNIRISYVTESAGEKFAFRLLPGEHDAKIPDFNNERIDAFWRLPTTGEFDECADAAFKMNYLLFDDVWCSRKPFERMGGTLVFSLPPTRKNIVIGYCFTALIRADKPELWFTTPWPCEGVEYDLISHPSVPLPVTITLEEGKVSKRNSGSTTRVVLRKRVPKGFNVKFSW